ncbi:hypothetical protein PoB_005275800 [Plakobranchus ocellatus]|uniref:Tyrosine-protein kinase ephrin type A/B receptor-like domain-containing protein n=1 Tax=Plakobranchus ocellatus TaxID=259542 RepID=A0AAV4C4C0_9GAST|nr:hypothetical protein PoB_005275800 [Plakobranchus ocellatus]
MGEAVAYLEGYFSFKREVRGSNFSQVNFFAPCEESNSKLPHNAGCQVQSGPYSWFPDACTKRGTHFTFNDKNRMYPVLFTNQKPSNDTVAFSVSMNQQRCAHLKCGMFLEAKSGQRVKSLTKWSATRIILSPFSTTPARPTPVKKEWPPISFLNVVFHYSTPGKIYANVILEYGIGVGLSSQASVCGDRDVVRKFKSAQFLSLLHTTRTRRLRVSQYFDPFWLSRVRADILSCTNVNNASSFVKVRIKNIPKGNGTKEEVDRFYSHVISETFKHLRAILANKGYKFRGNIGHLLGLVGPQAYNVTRPQDTYFGLYKTGSGGHVPVGYECPQHLQLKKESGEYLCVGCGKGWYVRRENSGQTFACYPCGPGFYTDLETATECFPCPVKYSTAPWDAAGVDDCFQISIPNSDRKRWLLAGFLMPPVYIGIIAIVVAWASK